MNKMSRLFLAAAVLPALLAGCAGGAMVKKEGIAETGRLALVSVAMPRLGDPARENNRTVLQAAADRALAEVHSGLKTARKWTVVDPSSYRGSAAVLSISQISDEELAALYPLPEERKTAKRNLEREIARWKQDFIGAKGLPVVPRSALVSEQSGTAAPAMVPRLMQVQAAGLCKALNVDAVGFVQILAGISHPRPKTFIVSGNRTDGAVHAAQTLVIVDKAGRVIVDMGAPALTGNARFRDLLPLYVGSGQDAIKPENIDLGDPQNKVSQAFLLLMEQTASDVIQKFKKAAAP